MLLWGWSLIPGETHRRGRRGDTCLHIFLLVLRQDQRRLVVGYGQARLPGCVTLETIITWSAMIPFVEGGLEGQHAPLVFCLRVQVLQKRIRLVVTSRSKKLSSVE